MKPKGKSRKQLLIYAGVAGAMLALVVLMKRKAAGTETANGETAGATYGTPPGSIPGVEGATGSGELATFENSLSAQLPQAIREGVAAGLAGNQTQSTPNNLAEVLASVGGLVTSLRQTPSGEQVGTTSPSPSQPAPSPTPAEHPAVTPRSTAPVSVVGSKPQTPSGGTPRPITCGNGCPGHRYPDGHTACQTKKGGHCSW